MKDVLRKRIFKTRRRNFGRDGEKRLYFLSEILTPHQLITYPVKVETKTYPLFDCLFWGQS